MNTRTLALHHESTLPMLPHLLSLRAGSLAARTLPTRPSDSQRLTTDFCNLTNHTLALRYATVLPVPPHVPHLHEVARQHVVRALADGVDDAKGHTPHRVSAWAAHGREGAMASASRDSG